MSASCFVLIVAAIGQDVVKPSSYTETKKTLEKLEVLIDKAEKSQHIPLRFLLEPKGVNQFFFQIQRQRMFGLKLPKKRQIVAKFLSPIWSFGWKIRTR